MVSVLDTQLFVNDVDFFLASQELYPKVKSPKSSLLMSPGTTNNSSNCGIDFSDENAFSFKENDALSFSRSISKDINEFDLSFSEKPQPEASSCPIKEISRMSEEALVQMITFVDQAANVEMQNCYLYNPMEFQSLLPFQIWAVNEGFKVTFKESEPRPEKMEKRLAKMRLLRGHQESFADHFCRFKDFSLRCKEGWNCLEQRKEEESNSDEIKEEKISQKSKKCKKTKNSNKRKEKTLCQISTNFMKNPQF